MHELQEFYLNRYKDYVHLLRTAFCHKDGQTTDYIEKRELPGYNYGKVLAGSIHADRRHDAGDHDAVTRDMFLELDEVFKVEKARLAAVFFIEALANMTCHSDYPTFHDRFQEKNKFPLTHGAVADSGWNYHPFAREVFRMAFGQDENHWGLSEPNEETKEWLASVLSGTVEDMKWIVFAALKRDEDIRKDIDPEEFWAKCVDGFPDWLKEEAQKTVRRA